jgi:hypothetical protein
VDSWYRGELRTLIAVEGDWWKPQGSDVILDAECVSRRTLACTHTQPATVTVPEWEPQCMEAHDAHAVGRAAPHT